MRQFILTGLLFSFFFLPATGQTENMPKDGPGFYFNSFQNHSGKNPDSALFYIRKLASDARYSSMLEDLLHSSFAQTFQKMWEREVKDSAQANRHKKSLENGRLILNGMMTDSNQRLVNAAKPIFFWTKIQENSSDDKKLTGLTRQFAATQLSTNDLFGNRVGRYALLIYQVISERETMKKTADELFKTIADKLKKNQLKINTDTASRLVLQKRTWYRYLYAYANFIQANKALAIKNNKKAGECYKIAFDYSPDLTDNNNASAYFYDMYFLLEKDKRSFQDDYLNYLTNYSIDKEKTLSTLLTMALINPTYKKQLKSFYSTHFPDREGFNEYWLKNISKNSKNAPGFSLRQLDGLLFSSVANKGKWILIDFWGTWCVPCRKEHPDLEKFYQTIKSSASNKVILLTVACRDQENKVATYMAQFNYSFPVAMADNEIENIYNIKGYPSKILISPQGKYSIVPFGADWVDFVNKYADL